MLVSDSDQNIHRDRTAVGSDSFSNGKTPLLLLLQGLHHQWKYQGDWIL